MNFGEIVQISDRGNSMVQAYREMKSPSRPARQNANVNENVIVDLREAVISDRGYRCYQEERNLAFDYLTQNT